MMVQGLWDVMVLLWDRSWKGKHDGVGVVVKCALWAKQLNSNGHFLWNARDVVQFLQATKIGGVASSYPSMSRCLLKWVFWHIKEIDVDRDNQWVVETLIGMCQIHCVASCSRRDPKKLAIKDLSCFCAFYVNEDYERCTFLHHVGIWKVHFIVLLNLKYIQSVVEATNEEDDWEHGGNGDEIVQSLKIEDNFVVNTTLGNEEDHHKSYVACCEKPLFEVNVDGLTDDWGNMFEPRSIVVRGRHYQRWGQGNEGDVCLMLAF